MDSPKYYFENRDPLASFIRSKLKWGPFKFGVFVLLLNLVVDFSATGLLGFLIIDGPAIGLLEDPRAILIDYVMLPLFAAYYLWSTHAPGIVFAGLQASTVFDDKTDLFTAKKQLRRRMNSRFVLIMVIAIATTFTGLVLGAFLRWYSWKLAPGFVRNSDILPWVRAPLWFLGMYTLAFGLFNIVVTILSLRKLFSNQTINISPWNPDRCGGLKSISQYVLSLSYAIAVLGVILSAITVQEFIYGTISTSYGIWIYDAAYVVGAFVIFLLPFGTAYGGMRKAKERYLLLVSAQFDFEYRQITENIVGDADQLDARIRKIEQLQKLYDLTEQFPVSLFRVPEVRRFLAITLSAIFPAIISIVLDWIRVSLNI